MTLCPNAEVVDVRGGAMKFDEKKVYNLGAGFFMQIGKLEFSYNTSYGIFFIKPPRSEQEKILKFNLPISTLEPLYLALSHIIGDREKDM